MRALITGGAGFLGINLIWYFLKKGIGEITCMDIAEFDYFERDRVRVIQGDIRDRDTVYSAVKGVDLVVHAAAALPLYSRDEIFSTDAGGTRNLLQASFRENVDRFVHISSTAVYGIPDHHPIREEDRFHGVGPYGKAKILAERLCERYRAKGMCIPILRPNPHISQSLEKKPFSLV